MNARAISRNGEFNILQLLFAVTVCVLLLVGFSGQAKAADFDQTDTFESGFGNWSNVTGDTQDWERGTSTTSGQTGPQSGGQGGSGSFVFTETSDPVVTADTFYLESNNLAAGTYDLSVSFYWHMYGIEMGSLHLDVWNGSSWDLSVWSRSGDNGDTWVQQTVDLAGTGYTSGTIKLRFRGTGRTGYRSDMAVDTVRIFGDISCIPTTGPVTVSGGSINGDPIDVCSTFNLNGSTLSNVTIDNGGPDLYNGASCSGIDASSFPASATLNISVDATDDCSGAINGSGTFDYSSCVSTTGPLTVNADFVLSGSTTDITTAINKNGGNITNVKVYEIAGAGVDIDETESFDGGGLTGWDPNTWTAFDQTGTTEQPDPPVNGDLKTDVISRSENTGPSSTPNGAFVFYESSVGAANDRYLTHSTSYDSSSRELAVDFDYNMNGADIGTLELQVRNTVYNGNAWNTEWTMSGDQGDVWNSVSVDLFNGGGLTAHAYNSGNTEIRFRFTYGGGPNGDIALDEVNIQALRSATLPAWFDDNETAAQSASTAGWSDGTIRVNVTGTDNCGGPLSAFGLGTFQSDVVAPTVDVFSMPSSSMKPVPVFSLTASDVGTGVVAYRITGGGVDTGWVATPPLTVTPTTTGNITFSATAKDLAGNVSTPATADVNVLVDGSGPVISTFSMTATSFSPITVNSLAATDDSGFVAGYLITESATPPLASDEDWTASPPTSVTTAATGSTTFYAWAKDASDNVSAAATFDVDVKVDNNDPVVDAFTFVPATSDSVTVAVTSFTASDTVNGAANNTGVVAYRITGTGGLDTGWLGAPPAEIVTLQDISDGNPHLVTFSATVKDGVGNVSSVATADVTFQLPASCDYDIDPTGTLIEVEDYTNKTAASPWDWSRVTTPLNDNSGDSSSGGYLNTTTGGTGTLPNGSRTDYPVNFTSSGTYCIWTRGMDAGAGDSTFWGVDNSVVGALTQNTPNEWTWTNYVQNGANCTTISAGAHTINLWPREAGQKTDAIIIYQGTGVPAFLDAGKVARGTQNTIAKYDNGSVTIPAIKTVDPTCVDGSGGGGPGGGGGGSGYITIPDGQLVRGTSINTEDLFSTDLGLPLTYRALGGQTDGFEAFTVDSKWFKTDIGGNATPAALIEYYDDAGNKVDSNVINFEGRGTNIYNTSDQFSYVYQPNISGDFTVDIQVASLENTNQFAKAGVMVRQSLSANSAHAMSLLTPSNGVGFYRRATNGGSTTAQRTAGINEPVWLRLVRNGNVFTSYYSSDDGSSWNQIGSSATINMTDPVTVGLALTSTNTGQAATGRFDNFLFMPAGYSDMSTTWTSTATPIDPTDTSGGQTAWPAGTFGLAVRGNTDVYQANTFDFDFCVDPTPSTLNVLSGSSVGGGAVSLNGLLSTTGNISNFSYTINGASINNPWNSFSVPGSDSAPVGVTLAVSGVDPDCGGTTMNDSALIWVDNTCSDPDPSTISILTGQTTGGSSVDLTQLFTYTGDVNTNGFTYKIDGTVIGDPTNWDSRAYGTQSAQAVTFEVSGIDPDCGNGVAAINTLEIDNTCVVNTPSIVFNKDVNYAGEGRAVPYTITIRNEDSFNCGDASFTVTIDNDSNNTDFVASEFPAGSSITDSNFNLIDTQTASITLGGRVSALLEMAVTADSPADEWNQNLTQVTVTYNGGAADKDSSGTVTTKVFLVSPITHNSVTTDSTKWGGKWGTSESGAEYGNFNCLLCHEKGGPNIKWMRGDITLPGLGTRDVEFKDAKEGPASPANEAEANAWGDDDPDGNDAGELTYALSANSGPGRTSSKRACEVCHTDTMYHRYDTSGQVAAGGSLDHFNGRDCVDCHRHSLGFTASCTGCHGNPPVDSSIGGPTGLSDVPGVTGSVTPGTHYKHVEVLNYPCEYCHDGWRNVGEMPKKVVDGADELYQVNHEFNVFYDKGINDAGGAHTSGYYTGQDGVNYTYIASKDINVDPINGTTNDKGTVLPGKGTLTCEATYCHGGTENMGGSNPQWNGSLACNSCHGTSATNTPPGYSHTTHVGKANLACTECHDVPAGEVPGYNGHVDGRVRVDMSGLPDTYGTPRYYGVNGTWDDPVWESNAAGNDLPPSSTYGSCSNVACHYGTETPVWNSGQPANCTTCHNDQNNVANFDVTGMTELQILQNAAPNSGYHPEHVKPNGWDLGGDPTVNEKMITAFVNYCESCHGGGANSGLHSGHMDYSLDVGGGMTFSDSSKTCTSQCHNLDGAVKATDAPVDIVWDGTGDNNNTLACQACHMAPYLGPTVVDPDNEGTGMAASGYGSHLRETKGESLTSGTNWTAQCRKCHPYHEDEGEADYKAIPLPPSDWSVAAGTMHADTTSPLSGSDMQAVLGLQYTVSGQINLGGSATSGSTEADICWNCHGNDPDDNEWGYNYDTDGGTWPDYNGDTGGSGTPMAPRAPTGGISAQSTTSAHNFGWVYTDAAHTTPTSAWVKSTGMGNYRYDAYSSIGTLSRQIASVHSVTFDKDKQVSSVKTSIDWAGTNNNKNRVVAAVQEKPDDIRCSYCHDVHDLNRAEVTPGDKETATGRPYLRGSWRSNPYPADIPPESGQSNTTRLVENDDGTADWYTPRALSTATHKGGYFIDRNSNMTNSSHSYTAGFTPADSAGLCALCHGGLTSGEIDAMDFYTNSVSQQNMWRGGNGHGFAALGGTRNSNSADLFDPGNGGHHYEVMGAQVWRGPGRGNQDFNWGDCASSEYVRDFQNRDVKRPRIYDTGWIPASGLPAQWSTSWNWNSNCNNQTVATAAGANDWYTPSAMTSPAGVADKYHNFTCSKCHSPHATGLPALLINNCVDQGASTWNSGTTRTQKWAMNCHRKESGAAGATGTGWHILQGNQ